MAEKAQAEQPVDVNKVKEYAKRYNAIASDMATYRADASQLLKEAEDVAGIHKGAFKQVLKLEGWDASKRADWLRAFDLYRSIFGIDDQGDMFDEDDQQQAAAQ